MIRKYTFFDGGTLSFDDEKSVAELIRYAFDCFGYYEPAGMEIVTLFQAYHPQTSTGWFTTDTSRKCSEEILNPDILCFAYYLPGIFYFAEGGWGHHMLELGNHPDIPDPVSLPIKIEGKFEDVVINGNYSFRDIIRYLSRTGYAPADHPQVKVCPVGGAIPYCLPLSDRLLDLRLTGSVPAIEAYTERVDPRYKSERDRVQFEIC
ncbi:MAG: hypothetical protein IK095_10205 [Oscillospiraceae bacterium]|nr:hypothetical protein [Oscillospiraceae bacterium]